MDFSNKYIIAFTVALCFVCSMAVSSLAVSLKPRIQENKLLDKWQNIVMVAGLWEAEPGGASRPTAEEVEELRGSIQALVIDRQTGAVVDGLDADTFEVEDLKADPERSISIPKEYSKTQVKRLADQYLVYRVDVAGKECVVLPVEGYGLWSTMRGFLALKQDLSEVVGLTFFEHGETPGLGGEVDNPTWKALWPGTVPYDAEGDVKLSVVKAGMVLDSSYQIDGLSGATITSKGVDLLLELWLGDAVYGPYLKSLQG